eukprot:XP_014055661.1 PREDICTED: uncharacterized protein LOC106604993 [Salmo salar]
MLPGILSRQYRDKATPGARPQKKALEVELKVEKALKDRAVVVLLTVCCLLQWLLATTGGQPGTKPHFYAVEMDGGATDARALAEQHGLQFISQYSNTTSQNPSSIPYQQPQSEPQLYTLSAAPVRTPALYPISSPSQNPSSIPYQQPQSEPQLYTLSAAPVRTPALYPISSPSQNPSSIPYQQPQSEPQLYTLSAAPVRTPALYPISSPSQNPSSIPYQQPQSEPQLYTLSAAPIGNLEGHFTLRDSRGRPDRAALGNTLAERAGVRWVQRQQTHYRDKRAVIRGLDPHHKLQEKQSELPSHRQDTLKTEDQLGHALTFNDPLWPMQWELFNHGQYSSSHFDLNVMPVWSRNITGNGVVVSIIDDGVDHTNMHLKRNFEAFGSFDLRGSHGLSHDPTPLRDEENGHGTGCTGEVAMEANNSYCDVGIAFNSRIGIDLLDSTVTDSVEATSLTFNNDFIDVYVCCWGPRDDGQEMAGPGTLTQKALRLGKGRGRQYLCVGVW